MPDSKRLDEAPVPPVPRVVRKLCPSCFGIVGIDSCPHCAGGGCTWVSPYALVMGEMGLDPDELDPREGA
jgi:hypothetical protein